MTTKPLQITVVGDGLVGKTCMLLAFTTERDLSDEEYIPTIFENYAGKIVVDGIEQVLELWDTAGQEGYERLRSLSYTNTSCFLICFALNAKSSYDNAMEVWVPEVRHFKPRAPIVLVGTKLDLRNNESDILSEDDGEQLRKNINGYKYCECSAMTRQGIQDVFETAIRAILCANNLSTKRRICRIL